MLAELAARELAPVRVDPVRERPRLRRRVPARQLATAYRQLADLLRAGVPLLRAIALVGRGRTSPRLASVIRAVGSTVAEGGRMADAMGEHPEVFTPVQVAMVRAGERGAFLEAVLARMAGFLEHQADLRAKVIGSMVYPLVLLGLSSLVVVGYLVFFVPKFQALYARIEVPLPTQIVLGASAALTRWWFVTAVVLIVLGTAAWWLASRPAVRLALARLQLRVPVIGPLVANLAVARFARMLGTLLANGVPLLAAIQIARDAAGHPVLAAVIDDAADAVREGEPLARPLAASRAFPEDVVEMISVGESANNLAEVLTSIADAIEKRIDRLLAIAVRLLEPLLLIVLGGVVMFIYMALVVPMMRMSSALQ